VNILAPTNLVPSIQRMIASPENGRVRIARGFRRARIFAVTGNTFLPMVAQVAFVAARRDQLLEFPVERGTCAIQINNE
jgi:hypothetical protein